ncbi:hypothetical protein N7507_008533 [Penicillium longicatenatum]|nr:hypothetical protein N7507_008533 [Penicillium longicatenatum]
MEAGIDPAHLDNKLRRLCGLFVFINNSKIYLVYLIAREFLIRKDVTSRPDSLYLCNLQDAEN